MENKFDEKFESVEKRFDSVEIQIKASERMLKNEIRNSEYLILDEVERVHNILEKHIHDTNKHLVG